MATWHNGDMVHEADLRRRGAGLWRKERARVVLGHLELKTVLIVGVRDCGVWLGGCRGADDGGQSLVNDRGDHNEHSGHSGEGQHHTSARAKKRRGSNAIEVKRERSKTQDGSIAKEVTGGQRQRVTMRQAGIVAPSCDFCTRGRLDRWAASRASDVQHYQT